jgi:YHS domain-containing protein
MEWLTQNWLWIVVAIGFFLLMQRARSFGQHGAVRASGRGPAPPEAALDPVSGNAVRTDTALTTTHGGRVFYFESAETRQRFEVEPERFAASAPVGDARRAGHSHHRGGCC